MSNFGNFNKGIPKNGFHNYLAGYKNEKFLFHSLSNENIMKNGITCKYFVISYNKHHNEMTGEDTYPIVDGVREVEFTFDLRMMPQELPPEAESWSAQGQEGLDTFKLICTHEHFRQRHLPKIPYPDYWQIPYRPKIGDVIKSVYNDMFYEVSFVNDGSSDTFFLQDKHIYEFTCKKYVIDQSVVTTKPEFADLKYIQDVNVNKLNQALGIDTLKVGGNVSTLPTEIGQRGKGRILFDSQDEINPNDQLEGW
jgi:hypothetical protein